MATCVLLAVLCCIALAGSAASHVLPSYDTIIVGLGAAGATAASTLARAGKRVLVLEAQNRVGGRVWTRPFGDGIVEAGAEWIHGLNPSRVYDLAVENDVPILFLDHELFVVHRSDGSDAGEELAELLWFCIYTMEEGSDVNEPMGDFIEHRVREHLQDKNSALLNDTRSLDTLLELMDLMVGNVEASNDWRDVTALRRNHLLEGSQNASWGRFGFKTLLEILLNTYNNGPGLPTLDIKLNKEVTNVQWNHDDGVLVTCRDGTQYSAPNVIVTVSLGVLKERYTTLFSPPLPQDKITAINVLSIGVVDKIILLFNEPWPAHTDIMFYWIPEDKETVPDGDKWITKLVGTSSPAGSNDTLTLWVSGETAKLVETLPEEVVLSKAVELLQRFVGDNITVSQPVAIIRTAWYSNPHTRGSYTYDSTESRSHPELRASLAAPLRGAGGAPRVLFAGEAVHSAQYGTVHGAADTGYRQARRIISADDL